MRWISALGAGIAAAIAIFAAFYGFKSFEDWQSGRSELAARIASLEGDPRNPNRDGNLKSARELLDLTHGVAAEKISASAVALLLALAAFVGCWRYASRFLGRTRLVAVALLGALAVSALGAFVLLMLGAGAIRG